MSMLDAVPEQAPPPTRTAWMDAARVVAIVAVVLIHVLAPTVEGRGVAVGSAPWWVADVLNSANRWCVPVFLMISGALALDPARAARADEQAAGPHVGFGRAIELAIRGEHARHLRLPARHRRRVDDHEVVRLARGQRGKPLEDVGRDEAMPVAIDHVMRGREVERAL